MKRLSRIVSVLLVLCMLLSLVPSVFADEDTVDFAFLVTSDLHGKIYATDYSSSSDKSGTYKQGLTRIATYIKEMKAQYGDLLYTVDLGDTIQGEPMTYYYAFNKPEEQPAIKAFRTLGYDMWLLGNHEFNYGIDILKKEMAYATSASTETENQLVICDANYLDADTNNAESKDWETFGDIVPYVIQDFNGVKVAIIGLSTPNIPKWDGPANWKGFYFESIYTTYKHYEEEMKEKADMIVVMAHTGINSEMADASYDSIRYLVEHTDSIDFVFSGHEHGRNVNDIQNSKGEVVKVLQPGTKAALVSQVKVSFNKTTKEATIDAQNINMANYAIDDATVAVLKPYEDYVWTNYMLKKIGSADGNFPAANLGSAPSAFMDLINTVQIWGAYDNTGENTPDDKTDDTPAQLSISAPLTSGDNANLISKGDILLGDLFALYRYENWFYQLTMSGKEIRTWLEYSASKLKLKSDGSVDVQGGLTYYDVIYGDGFSYVLDPMQPEGLRVTSMTYNGKEVTDDQEFTIVMNNYRFTGGGNYVKYLKEHGCDLSDLEDRVIYSTQYDMKQGEDLGQARALLQAYIEKEETITPTITSTWSVDTSSANDITILYTNDVHTYIDGDLAYDNIAALKDAYEALGKGVLLVDAGDHIQGTAYGSMDKGESIIKLMNAAGYDAATLGNHEFDYGMARTLAIIEEANFPYLSANFYHEKDGVAGESVLDAYKIFTVDGKKIALVGLTTPESFTKSTPKYFQDENGNYIYGIAGGTDGKALYTYAQKAIDAAKAEGADYIIALGHLGDDPSSKPWTSEELIANTTGLDAFIDGHSHSTVVGKEVKDKEGKTVLLTQTGSYFNAIGKMTISKDGKISTSLIKAYSNSDADVKAIKDEWMKSVDDKLGVVIAHADITLDNFDEDNNRLVRKQETNTGDFAADALFYQFETVQGLHVDAAIMNGGGVRNKAITGDISYKTCKDIHTFGNVACLISVTGQQILDALEWGAKDANSAGTKECGGFLQVSGITYEVHVDIPSTVRKDDKGVWTGGPTGEYRVKNVTIGGEPLDVTKTYNLAGYNYTLRDLGDGFAMFKGAENILDYVKEDYMVLADYVQSFPKDEVTGLPTITAENSPYGDVYGVGRITIVKNPFTDVPSNAWYTDYVLAMYNAGLVSGMTKTTFEPNTYLDRGMWVTLVWRMAGEPECETASSFTDVKEGRYYSKAVAWAEEVGIVSGVTETTFEPESYVTREQMVSILYRAIGAEGASGDLSQFPDSSAVSNYAVDAMSWAVGEGIISGVKDGGTVTLDPQGNTTRAQAATVMTLFILWFYFTEA